MYVPISRVTDVALLHFIAVRFAMYTVLACRVTLKGEETILSPDGPNGTGGCGESVN